MTTGGGRSPSHSVEVILALGVCLRTCGIYDLSNSLVASPVQRLVTAVNGSSRDGGTLAIQLVNEKFFINKRFVRLDAASYEQTRPLMQIFRRLKINEIAFHAERLEARQLLIFLEAYKRHLPTSQPERLMLEAFDAVAVRAIDGTEADAFDETSTPQKTLVRQYSLLLVFLERVAVALQQGEPVRLAGLRRMLQKLADASEGLEPLLVALGGLPQIAAKPQAHQVRCSAMALLMGKKLGLARGALIDVAFAALFHDIARDGSEAAGEGVSRDPMRRLARQSVLRMCRGGVGLDTHLRIAVAHDVWSQLKASPTPSLPARLIAVPCAFDLLTQPSTGLAPELAVRFLARAGSRYDSRMVRLFAASVGVFPAGTVLDLSDGSMVLVKDGATPNGQPRVQMLRRGTQSVAPGAVTLAGSAGAEERRVNVTHFFLE